MINKKEMLKSLIDDLESMSREELIGTLDEYGVEYEFESCNQCYITMINGGNLKNASKNMFQFKKPFLIDINLYEDALESNDSMDLINKKEFNKFYYEERIA